MRNTRGRALEVFSSACRRLGVAEAELLLPEHLIPGPQRSADALVRATRAFAREAALQGALPALAM